MQLYQCMKYVSILVLMDITLLRFRETNENITDFSFNPCFNGYYTSTKLENTKNRPRN